MRASCPRLRSRRYNTDNTKRASHRRFPETAAPARLSSCSTSGGGQREPLLSPPFGAISSVRTLAFSSDVMNCGQLNVRRVAQWVLLRRGAFQALALEVIGPPPGLPAKVCLERGGEAVASCRPGIILTVIIEAETAIHSSSSRPQMYRACLQTGLFFCVSLSFYFLFRALLVRVACKEKRKADDITRPTETARLAVQATRPDGNTPSNICRWSVRIAQRCPFHNSFSWRRRYLYSQVRFSPPSRLSF